MKWDFIDELIDPHSIERFEKLVGYTFPEDFKQTVRLYNGGYPEPNAFDMKGEKEKVFSCLVSFNENDDYSLWDYVDADSASNHEWLIEGLDWRYVPFADDPFGNMLCFDRTNDHIVFWDHEEEDGGMYFVASSFTELINSLYEVEYDDDEF